MSAQVHREWGAAQGAPGVPPGRAWEPAEAAFDDVAAALAVAEDAVHPAERYLAAHRAALRVAAGVLERRRPRLRERCSIWAVVAHVAPVLGEWAQYFGAIQLKVQAVQAGAVGIVTEREADDLVRDARAFARAAGLEVGVHG